MLKLIKYLNNYKKESFLAPFFKLLEASFELLVPLVMANIIDNGIAGNNSALIYKMGAVLVFLGTSGLMFSITAQYFSAKAAVGFGTELRDDLFRHIMNLSHNETDKAGQSTLITRMTNDTNQIQSGVNMFFRLVLRSPFIVIGAMIMASTIKKSQALIFLFVILVLALIIIVIMRTTVSLYRIVQKKLDTVMLKTSENLSGVRVIRAFNREASEMISFAIASESLADEQIKVGKISAFMNPITFVVANLGIVAILRFGSIDVSIGNLSQGQVVALVNYMSQILVELLKLANLIIILSKASACAKRVNEIFDLKNTLKDGNIDAVDVFKKDSYVDAVVFDNVGFTYPGMSKEALSNISFTAHKGETIGIIGGTGSGKSTLVSLIPRFYDVSSGTISVYDSNIKEYTLSSLRKIVGVVAQTNLLFKGTIESNLKMGKQDATNDEIDEAVNMAQAKDVIAIKKAGIKADVLQEGKNLSGGQKQRISIARTLIIKPKILILDDASSALDYSTEASLRTALKKISDDTTVFMVSQRVTSLIHADKIIVMDDGHMVGYGTHKILLSSCEVYREICLSQLSKEEVCI